MGKIVALVVDNVEWPPSILVPAMRVFIGLLTQETPPDPATSRMPLVPQEPLHTTLAGGQQTLS